ncbi:phage tail protein [Serratia sp. 14-2641]|uniref:phage tail fiber protein n=1 Tax=Serratia sp. 14-2641 TaxID=1841657 RepID=UPI000817967B|nr:phage tail protein [Serratia sp. 14-2641]OCJ30570.1 hypothetical protein A6U95_06615 [Serratia sp. 14-2641]
MGVERCCSGTLTTWTLWNARERPAKRKDFVLPPLAKVFRWFSVYPVYLAELSSATNSTSETLAATPKAVKAVQDAVSALDKLTVKTVNTHKPDTAGNVKLGTAADADVQTSVADLTVGHVLTVGKAFGLGLVRTDQTALSLMRSTSGYTGFTWSANNDPEAPSFLSAHASIGIQNQIWKDSSGQSYVLQTAWRDGKIGFRTVEANTVGPWCEYFHTKNLPTATQTGALPLTGGTMAGEIKSTSANAVRMIQGGYGVILRMDANGFYILQTNKDDSNGNYNGNRSLTIANNNGAVTIGAPFTVNDGDFIRKDGVNTYVDSGITYHQTNGVTLQGMGDQYVQSYALETVGQRFALRWRIHSGGVDGWPEFRNDGSLYLAGNWPVIQNSAGTTWHSDGNIQGACWGGDYLSNYLHSAILNIGQISVSGTQWWVKMNVNGGTLIVQGGYAEVQDAEVTDRIPLNIAVPNRLLHVSITNRNFAQGYATYNPQVSTLTDDNTGFNFVHGKKERMIYWMAVGY